MSASGLRKRPLCRKCRPRRTLRIRRLFLVREAYIQPNYVKVQLRCSRRQESLELCVRVDRGVPEDLRCTPSGSAASGTGSGVCDECDALLRGDELAQMVNELTRRGWSDHRREGAVLVGC